MAQKESIFGVKPNREKSKDVDSWVNAGKEIASSASPSGPLKRIIFTVDPDLHNRLKIHCVKNNISIKDFLTGLINRNVE